MLKLDKNVEMFYSFFDKKMKECGISYKEIYDLLSYKLSDHNSYAYKGRDELLFLPREFSSVESDGYMAERYANRVCLKPLVDYNNSDSLEPCCVLMNGFDRYLIGNQEKPGLVYERVFVKDDTLFTEKYYDKKQSNKILELDVYSNCSLDYIVKNAGEFDTNNLFEEFVDYDQVFKNLAIEPAFSIKINKDVYNTYGISIQCNDSDILDKNSDFDYNANAVPVDYKTNYEQVKDLEETYYHKFIKPLINGDKRIK